MHTARSRSPHLGEVVSKDLSRQRVVAACREQKVRYFHVMEGQRLEGGAILALQLQDCVQVRRVHPLGRPHRAALALPERQRQPERHLALAVGLERAELALQGRVVGRGARGRAGPAVPRAALRFCCRTAMQLAVPFSVGSEKLGMIVIRSSLAKKYICGISNSPMAHAASRERWCCGCWRLMGVGAPPRA
jgi:hypothetical protein